MNKQEFPAVKSNETDEKRIWVSPKIEDWESVNLEFAGGIGPDGASKTYV
ncbi:hypothetical protein AQBE111736_00265 [Aquirufa beregesia]|nr:hypothetical protein [Aquirufa beregesia]